jgi:hypothetical protein
LLEAFLIIYLNKGSSDVGKMFVAVDKNFLCYYECLFSEFGFSLSFGNLDKRYCLLGCYVK